MPARIVIGVSIVLVLALLPFLLIAKARVTRSDRPRIHLIQDMDNQPRFKAQQSNPLFADGRAMRPRVPGTVARGEMQSDTRFYQGKDGGEWVTEFPRPLTLPVMERGQKEYAIYCAPCHGLSGYGDGIVALRADRLQEGTWTAPTSLHSDTVLARPVGHIFNTITHGIRNMPAYGTQIPPEDRWAIVAYVRALQRSQRATLDDVPAEYRAQLETVR
ncbi:MAG: cytochrome c [Candidatus Omnitrophica bacterium]|nr:cytochrome c [Candidatus Omnitrophota bacterium]